MSQQNSNPTIYDGLLLISLAAVIMGCVFFVLALSAYGFAGPPGS